MAEASPRDTAQLGRQGGHLRLLSKLPALGEGTSIQLCHFPSPH